ncbi:MAG: isocitrate dehydrogenase (NADP(+)) [Euryarchaeota archaeon]|nr:isocitrate dehydrogenase (NADP(+)) [Euryarchaeota archaeon]
MTKELKLSYPSGEKITYAQGALVVPDRPIIPVIEGDGTGPDICRAALPVLQAAVKKAYGGKRELVWFYVPAGAAAGEEYGELLPKATLAAIRDCRVAIKGPLTTPIGGGFRSVNVALRQQLDLYACIRPVYWIKGITAPVRSPEKLDIVIFRENIEDVYAGIEWKAGSPEADRFIGLMRREFGVTIRADSGVGVKPMSAFGTKRLVRRAIRYAIDEKRPVVTIVHKGNVMKYTEGAFRDWGYEVATTEFREHIVTEKELTDEHHGKMPAGKVLVNDRIADNMLQQLLIRPSEYSVIAAPNLNGDYLSDAAAGQVGGLGMAPGSNIGDGIGIFEATHGSAPKYAGQDKVNPGSVILSGVMMLEFMGWREAAKLVKDAVNKTVAQKRVTYDLARDMKDVTPIKCSEFGKAVTGNL